MTNPRPAGRARGPGADQQLVPPAPAAGARPRRFCGSGTR